MDWKILKVKDHLKWSINKCVVDMKDLNNKRKEVNKIKQKIKVLFNFLNSKDYFKQITDKADK